MLQKNEETPLTPLLPTNMSYLHVETAQPKLSMFCAVSASCQQRANKTAAYTVAAFAVAGTGNMMQFPVNNLQIITV